ncbi:MAG TPA: hypothetical protein VLZ83_12655 [Edaphocola sp.]|nr:hypothetical protein [Edaphocola sp.]
MENLGFLSNRIQDNTSQYQKYFHTKLYSFCELEGLRKENIFCLILELYQASIFTSNHLLERLLKLALIKNHTRGYNYSDPIAYNKILQEAILQFDGRDMNEIIERCASKKIQLIDKEQEAELKNLKDKVRNPYSHAETAKINHQSPTHFKGFMFNLNEASQNLINKEEIKLLHPTYISKHSPPLAQLFQDNNSKMNALKYFDKINQYINYFEGKFNEK